MGHFRDVLPCQSFSTMLKKLTVTQQKQARTNKSKRYFNKNRTCTKSRVGLSALYNIQPKNGSDPLLQPRGTNWALGLHQSQSSNFTNSTANRDINMPLIQSYLTACQSHTKRITLQHTHKHTFVFIRACRKVSGFENCSAE